MKYWYPYEKANLLLFPRQVKPNMDLQRHANPSLSLKVVILPRYAFVIHVILPYRMSEWFKKISITSNKLLEFNLFVETFYYFRFLFCLSKMPYFFLITIKNVCTLIRKWQWKLQYALLSRNFHTVGHYMSHYKMIFPKFYATFKPYRCLFDVIVYNWQ